MAPQVEGLPLKVRDLKLVSIDIGNWKTPVAQQFGITQLPAFRLYDKEAKLLAQGDAAFQWVMEQAKRAEGWTPRKP